MKSIWLKSLENTFSQLALETVIYDIILAELQKYSNLHSEKVLGAVLPRSFHAQCPSLFPYLWLELDIKLMLLDEELGTKRTAPATSQRIIVSVMAR
jgi:formate dehydrogenase maturation protein FdhE